MFTEKDKINIADTKKDIYMYPVGPDKYCFLLIKIMNRTIALQLPKHILDNEDSYEEHKIPCCELLDQASIEVSFAVD